MRLRFTLPALLAMLLLALSLVAGTGVGAQDEPEVDVAGELQAEDFEGLEHGVVRAYSFDYSAMLDTAATPGAEFQMPTGVFLLGATILEFDNDDNAQAALDKLAEETSAEDGMGMSEDAEVTEIELDLGENSLSWSSVEDVEGVESETVITLVQQDEYVYFVVAGGSGEDMQDIVVDFANVVIENEGSGEGEFNEDGSSTGGLWDKFPAADDELVAGLIPYDQVLYPEPAGTPEA